MEKRQAAVGARRELGSVDLVKFIASVMIFLLHNGMLKQWENVRFAEEVLSRWGVPFFFLSSAYFLFRKGEGGNITGEQLRGYARRIALLYAGWFVFNLPSVAYMHFIQYKVNELHTWVVFVKNAFFSASFTGSWFLTSCVFGAWLVWLLSRRLSTGRVVFATAWVYAICVLTSMYKGIIPKAIVGVLNFCVFPLNIFNGCFYFAVGKAIAENEERIRARFPRPVCAACFLVAYALYFGEIAFARRAGIFSKTDVGVFLIPASIALFLFCLETGARVPGGRLLRKMSTIFFFCQGNIICVRGFCAEYLGVRSIHALNAVCLALLAAVTAAVLLAQRRTKWRWPHYLT